MTAGAIGDTGSIRVRAEVRNTGARPGSDVVQVYARRRGSDRPARLGRIRPGRTSIRVRHPRWTWPSASAGLAERDLARHATVVRPGTYELRIGRHARDPGIGLEVEVEVEVAAPA